MKVSVIELERIVRRLGKFWQEWRSTTGEIYIDQRVSEYHGIWQAVAKEIGASFVELESDIWEIQLEGRKTRVLNGRLEFDNPVVLDVAGRKPTVHRLLSKAGIPVPEYRTFSLSDSHIACEFVQECPNGCVIKPANGGAGRGVTTHVLKPSEVRSAAVLASLYCNELLIEEQVLGESYRILVINRKMVHAVKRSGIWMAGDGHSTISCLLERMRVEYQSLQQGPIDRDRDLVFSLTSQNLTLNSVPAQGQTFLLKCARNHADRRTEVRTVYTDDVTNFIGNDVRNQALLAAKIVGSDLLGVDVITTDVTKGLWESGGVINELNTTPGFHHHYNSKAEPYPKPALVAIRALLGDETKALQSKHSGERQ